jgi:hypothetical protein
MSAPVSEVSRVQEVRCPLCGGMFPGREACASGCPLSGSCRTLCCPHCHYRFVEDSVLARFVGRLVSWRKA